MRLNRGRINSARINQRESGEGQRRRKRKRISRKHDGRTLLLAKLRWSRLDASNIPLVGDKSEGRAQEIMTRIPVEFYSLLSSAGWLV